ncbi:MFS transporter [Opitutaceae bacterium EW11]|nr:MFS transporter [Opitutaceae bacterium EW11]
MDPTAASASSATEPTVATSTVLRAAVVAALGGLLFGFETAVISGTTGWLRSVFALSDFTLGFTVSSALIGTMIGSVAAGRPADQFGRKAVLFVLAGLFFISALGCAFAWSWPVFLAFRFLGGLGVGGASVVSPLYIAEIAPAPMRGRLVAITQFNIVLGILLAYLSNFLVGQMHLGAAEWRWMFGVMAAPAAVFFALLFAVPQSPRWLVARGRAAEARAVLEKCRAETSSVEGEIAEIQKSVATESGRQNESEPLFQRKYFRPVGLAVSIAMFNQLSGINALIYYTADIFRMAGAGTQSALLQSVIIGTTNLLFTVAAMAVIDRFGRRKLMLAGSVGYIVSLAAVAWAFHQHTGGAMVLGGLLVFIAAHAFGQGAVIWVFISEIFPTRVRARGQALGSTTHWVMAAAISWTFPIIAAKAGWMAFAFYAVCCVGQLLWVVAAMPETKGISLEQIQKKLGID